MLRFSMRMATRFASACRIHAFAVRSARSVPAVPLAPLFLLLSALAPPPPLLIGGWRLSSRGDFLTALLDWTLVVVVVVSCAAVESSIAVGSSVDTAFLETCGGRDME